jgi:hypothetical protein
MTAPAATASASFTETLQQVIDLVKGGTVSDIRITRAHERVVRSTTEVPVTRERILIELVVGETTPAT